MDWTKLAGEDALARTEKALKDNGFNVFVVGTGEEARKKALELIKEGSEVFTVSSTTVHEIGLSKELNESGKYDSVRNRMMSMDMKTQHREAVRITSSAEWSVGSAHAVTEDGKVMIASASGSQLPGYSYGSPHVLWVIGTQKIVKDVNEGFRRIQEHSLPLESERARKAYGIPGSSLDKILIMQKEHHRQIDIILVKEALGF